RRHTRFSRDWSSDVCSSDLGPWSIGAESQFLLRQEHVAPGEPPSPGYTLVSAHAVWQATSPHVDIQIFLHATNLLDAEARPHPRTEERRVGKGGRARWTAER